MVPERAGEVAANGDQTRKQDGGEVFARCLFGDGHVPWAHGVHPVAAPAQPPVQRDGGPAKSKLDGLPIAPVLRLMSAPKLNSAVESASPIRAATVWCEKIVNILRSERTLVVNTGLRVAIT